MARSACPPRAANGRTTVEASRSPERSRQMSCFFTTSEQQIAHLVSPTRAIPAGARTLLSIVGRCRRSPRSLPYAALRRVRRVPCPPDRDARDPSPLAFVPSVATLLSTDADRRTRPSVSPRFATGFRRERREFFFLGPRLARGAQTLPPARAGSARSRADRISSRRGADVSPR